MKTQITGNRRTKSLGRRILSRVMIFFLFLASIPLMGFTYEKIAEFRDGIKNKAPGKVVDIQGHDMHIYAKGEGKETVVFSSGHGIPSPYADLYPLYNEIAKHTRIAVYDRPGYGWSEVADTARDVDIMAKELHELLEKSGEKPPYILVGHSIASLELIRFAQLYKNEVKAMVTVDCGSPEFYANQVENLGEYNFDFKSKLTKLGVLRLLYKLPKFSNSAYAARNNFSNVPPELKEIDKAFSLKIMSNKNQIDEVRNKQSNAAKVVAGGKLGDIPLRILTSENGDGGPQWLPSQEAFKSWSADSSQMVVKGTNHNVHQFAPEVVNKEILKFVENQ